MKLKVETWRIIWRYLVTLAVIYLVSFLALLSVFLSFNQETNTLYWLPFSVQHIVIISIFLGAGIIILFPTIFSYYYVVESKYFLMKKYWKIFQFDYANIEFIDIDESKRKKMVIFYSPTCGIKYLLGDKDGVLLETIIKKSHANMSVEEFKSKHPEVRY